MERSYYICSLRLDGFETFVIWYEDVHDGFVRDAQGRLLWEKARNAVFSVAAKLKLQPVSDEIAFYDFDEVASWCQLPTAAGVNCKSFLNAWNFFDDLAELHDRRDTPYSMLSRAKQQSYDKIFWGNNLPSLTPPGESFTPMWQAEELDGIRQVMEAGLALLRSELRR